MAAGGGAPTTVLFEHTVNQKTSHGGLERTKMKIQDNLLLAKLRDNLSASEGRNRQYIRLIRQLERERDASLRFGVKNIVKITEAKPSGKSEATVVVLCSDWHIEETVKGSTISGLNEYNLDIAKDRSDRFWRTVARMVHIYRRDIPIPTMLLWLGGD